jgi:hypothetical protein
MYSCGSSPDLRAPVRVGLARGTDPIAAIRGVHGYELRWIRQGRPVGEFTATTRFRIVDNHVLAPCKYRPVAVVRSGPSTYALPTARSG